MKLYTSYFYQIRFFKPCQIPLSTACYDPKWYHENKGPKHKFLDRRSVLNGLRAEELHPGPTCHNLCHGHDTCTEDPSSCRFLEEYRKQIFSIDKEAFLERLRSLESRIQRALHIEHEIEFILIVHEKTSQRCSERSVLQDFFNCTELTF